MEPTQSKRTSSSSKERGGISTGGVYIRIDKIERIKRLLFFQLHQEPTDANIRTFMDSLFTLADQQIGDLLAREEFKAATTAAFPTFSQEIEDLLQFALRIAKILRNEDTIRPQKAVNTKLYEELAELHEVIMQVEHEHLSSEKAQNQIDVRLRLASVLYYAVQNLKHDLALAATSPQNVTLEDATNTFRVIVMNACTQANCTLFVGFTSAVRKFGCRSLLKQKNVPAERLLVSSIDELPSIDA